MNIDIIRSGAVKIFCYIINRYGSIIILEGLEASNRLESVRNRKNGFFLIDIDVQIFF